jgi:hypothetical protein
MGESGNDIIIKGGSAEIEFDPTRFVKDPSDPKKRKHKGSLNIKQIIIAGDGEIEDFKTRVHSSAFKGTIRVVCE